MTEELKLIIEELYSTFGKYKTKSKLEGSPIYDDLTIWVKELKSKELKKLSEEDLSRFAGKVILTWGNEDDYKYYLPRIFELTALYKTPYDIWTLYSRLEDANWLKWDIDEQNLINKFTLELWNNILNENSETVNYLFKDYFHTFAFYFPNFSIILDKWETHKNPTSTIHLSNYILEENKYLFDKNYLNSVIKNTKNINQFKTWLTSDKLIYKIQDTFFEIDDETIKEQLSWVEQILTNEKK